MQFAQSAAPPLVVGPPPQPPAPVVTPDTVTAWLHGALSPDASERAQAERALAAAEEAASPGYMSSLLDIVCAVDGVAEVRDG